MRFVKGIFRSFTSHCNKTETCWKCNATAVPVFLTCKVCKYIQDPSICLLKMNHFEIFDLKQDYVIDQGLLKKKYLGLQTKFHPDKITSVYKEEVQICINKKAHQYSQIYASTINEGYSILADDYKRAKYILNLHGFKKDEEIIQDPEFLEEIFFRTEEIEETECPEELNKILVKISEEKIEILQGIKEQFEKENLNNVSTMINRLNYINRLGSIIIGKLDSSNN